MKVFLKVFFFFCPLLTPCIFFVFSTIFFFFFFFFFHRILGAFLVRRYNVKTLPCYLAFQGGKLVACKAMGGKAVQLTRASDSPHALLYEPDFAAQIKTEKIMRKLNWRWDLCTSFVI